MNTFKSDIPSDEGDDHQKSQIANGIMRPWFCKKSDDNGNEWPCG